MTEITMEINDLTWQGHCWPFFSEGRYTVYCNNRCCKAMGAVEVVQVKFSACGIDTFKFFRAVSFLSAVQKQSFQGNALLNFNITVIIMSSFILC